MKEREMLQSKVRNNKIDIIKAVCIFSVICAHTTSENDTVNRILQLFGVCGVPIFLFFSSFFFYRGKQYERNREDFWKTKILQIILPWLLFGSVTWVINNLFGSKISSLSLASYLTYMLGYQSHLYFMTILVLFFLTFRQRNKVVEIIEKIGLVLSIVAVIYVDNVGLSNLGVYPYLNPLFWIGFWSLGRILAMIDGERFVKLIPYLMIFDVVFVVAVWIFGRHYISYFSIWTLLLSVLNIFLCFVISSSSRKIIKSTNIVIAIGRNTQFVYLTHIVVIGALNLFLKDFWVYDFIKPVLTWLLYVVLLAVISKLCSKWSRIKNIIKYVGIKE